MNIPMLFDFAKMTHDEIMKLEAGRELDTLVAERVMGWKLKSHKWIDGETRLGDFPEDKKETGTSYRRVLKYTTDISAAWEVVEKMNSEGFAFYILWTTGIPWAMFDKDSSMEYSAEADTAPLAICRAALLIMTKVQP